MFIVANLDEGCNDHVVFEIKTIILGLFPTW